MSKIPAQTEHSQSSHHKRFQRGIEQFNAGQFFDAHETWEEIWLTSPEPEKTFLQGIIQISAAFHHYGRGNMRGTRSLLEAGLRRIARFGDMHNGIALQLLRSEARQWTAELAAGADPGWGKIPQIHVSRSRAKSR